MEILLKLTIPDNTIKEIDEVSEKLWPEYCWWDIVNGVLKNISERIGGKIEFVRIKRKKKRWFRRVQMEYLAKDK